GGQVRGDRRKQPHSVAAQFGALSVGAVTVLRGDEGDRGASQESQGKLVLGMRGPSVKVNQELPHFVVVRDQRIGANRVCDLLSNRVPSRHSLRVVLYCARFKNGGRGRAWRRQ